MRTLDRYIAANLALHFAYSLLILLAIFTVVNFMREAGDVGTGEYGFGDAVWFILLTLPNEAYKLIPAAALLGSVTGLGDLAAANELVAIGAAGVSRWRLSSSVLQAAAVLMIGALLLGELVAAPQVKRAQAARTSALSGGLAVGTAAGFWTRDGSRFVNVRGLFADGTLFGLYVFDFDDDGRMTRFTYARKGRYTEDRWGLEDVVDSSFSGDNVVTRQAAAETWDTPLTPRELKFLLMSPEDLSLRDLYRSMRSLRQRVESSEREQLAFWRRLTWPLVTAVMVYIALPFVLGSWRRSTAGMRIAVSALAGVGFDMLNTTFGAFALAYGVAPPICALLPAAIALVGGLIVMRRMP